MYTTEELCYLQQNYNLLKEYYQAIMRLKTKCFEFAQRLRRRCVSWEPRGNTWAGSQQSI